MKNIKRILCLVMVCIMAECLTGCDKLQTNRKYDVTIKIVNNFGSEWIFTPDVEELSFEILYTGEGMSFYVSSYQLVDHPRWKDEWLEATGHSPYTFKISNPLYWAPGEEKNQLHYGPIVERGKYNICITTSRNDLWNFRAVYLNVTIV